MSLEQRILELEVRAAHQEKLIEELDGVVVEFTARVEHLQSLLKELMESTDAAPIGPANDPPPHY